MDPFKIDFCMRTAVGPKRTISEVSPNLGGFFQVNEDGFLMFLSDYI